MKVSKDMLNKIRAAIYCRLSRDDDDKFSQESESINNQKNMLTQYARERGWEIYDYYIDDGYTGLNFDRPGFKRLYQDIANHCIDVVIIKDQSRIGRDNSGVDNFLYSLLPSNNVRCIGVLDGLDTHNKQTKKASQVMGLTNEWYSEDISNKVRGAFDAKRRNGEFIGAIPPYGYNKSQNNKNQLVIDDEVSWVVEKIFNMYVSGYGYTKIAKTLNEKGIPSPSNYKNIFNHNAAAVKKEKRLWSYHTIRRILKSEVYIGNLVQKTQKVIDIKSSKKVATHPSEHIKVSGTHDPIIDHKTFNLVQEMIGKNTKARPRSGLVHLFSGMCKCGDCGRALQYRSDRDVLECSTHKQYGIGYCTSHRIKCNELKDEVFDDIKGILGLFNEVEIQEEIHKKYLKSKSTSKVLDIEISKIEKRISEVSKLKKGIYEDYKEDILTKDEYLELKNGYANEEKELSERQDSLLKQRVESKNIVNEHDDWKDVYRKYIDSDELSREMLIELVDTIFIYQNKDGQLRIKIEYKYPDCFSEYVLRYKHDISLGRYNITTVFGKAPKHTYSNIFAQLVKQYDAGKIQDCIKYI